MVVVPTRGDEQDVAGGSPARHVVGLEDHVEAHDPDVERPHPVDVGGAQVDVPDADLRVDRIRGRHRRIVGSLRSAHGRVRVYAPGSSRMEGASRRSRARAGLADASE